LYHIYSDSRLEAPIHTKILGSLEKWWAVADQDVFILAVLLNPWIRGHPFSKKLLSMDLFNMADRVFKRLFSQDPKFAFMAEFIDYYEGVEKFLEASMGLDGWKAKFNEQVSIQNSLVSVTVLKTSDSLFYTEYLH
jgi:hypothetical protein